MSHTTRIGPWQITHSDDYSGNALFLYQSEARPYKDPKTGKWGEEIIRTQFTVPVALLQEFVGRIVKMNKAIDLSYQTGRQHLGLEVKPYEKDFNLEGEIK